MLLEQTNNSQASATEEVEVTRRLQVVLDLDNTLIHSLKREPSPGDPQSFKIIDHNTIAITESNAKESTETLEEDQFIYVYKRPYLD